MNKKFFKYQDIKYDFNPFGGINEEEISRAFVMKKFTKEIIENIENDNNLALEFIGEKGRGKTTHLRWLQCHFDEYPIFLLDSNAVFDKIIADESDIVFVDSIHHLSFFQRLKLFRLKKKVIFTTHFNRYFECKIVGKKIKSYRFEGINKEDLVEIIKNRLSNAASLPQEEMEVDIEVVEGLINEFGDDYRGILNFLYDEFQSKNDN